MGSLRRVEAPMKKKFIPVNEPVFDGNEKKYLAQCIDTGWISSEGPFVAKLERDFAAVVERKFGVAVSNGTTAIDIAIEALGIGPGDEVILPSFTIISCLLQILRCGAVPVFVDADERTWNMDVSKIENLITPRTKAIMVVHIYGLPVDMDTVLKICEIHNLLLIEDAAEAIGLTYKGKPCGSFGDISTVSFYPNKHVTTGEGGMVLTNDAAIAESAASLRNLCFEPDQRFVHRRLGWNARMSNLQAAVGVAQLERLPRTLKRKREIGALYQELLNGCPGLQLPVPAQDYADNTYWVFGVLVDRSKIDASELRSQLNCLGIGTRPFFYPLNQQPILKLFDLKTVECPVSLKLYETGLYLPSGLGLTDDDVRASATAVKGIMLSLR